MSRHWAVLWVLSMMVACSGKLCGAGYLAELEEHHGEVQRDRASAVTAWGAVTQGDRFEVGDGLRTGRSGGAQLSLASNGRALVEPNTVLRFLDRDPRGGSGRLSLEEGAVRIDSGNLDLDVHTVRGLARLTQGSSIRILSADTETRFDVLVGRVAIDTEGELQQLAAGETLRVPAVAVGAVGEADGATPDAGQAAEPEGTRAIPTGVEPPSEPAPPGERSGVDLALPEADSMTLHAPSLPLTFRLSRPACAGAVTAELDGRAVAEPDGDESLLLRISTVGAHRLRVRCAKRIVRESIVRVQRDAANLELPKSAQRVDVEADGRRYTVRYHNVMPLVNITWSDARPASGYSLVLRRGGREQSYRSSKPVRELPGSELVEGNYEFWFDDASGQKSRVGALRIEFDNTARSLSLSEPVDGSLAEGDQVLVSGVALLRSQVSANGVPLALDTKGRFRAQVPLSAEKSVLVRANHPAAGVHYYLRRLR